MEGTHFENVYLCVFRCSRCCVQFHFIIAVLMYAHETQLSQTLACCVRNFI